MRADMPIWRLCALLLLWITIRPDDAIAQMQVQIPPTPCVPYVSLAQNLQESWGESRFSEALGADGRMWVVFARSDGQTWSLATVDAHGTACVVMLGRNFTTVDAKPAGKPS